MNNNDQGTYNPRVIQDAIRKLAGTYNVSHVKTCDATVDSVNEAERTCIVSSIDGKSNIDGLTVRLMPEIDDGDLNVPAIGSTITISFNDDTEPYMISATELSKKNISIGDVNFRMTNGNVVITQGKAVLTMSGGKISIKNDSVDYLTLQKNILNHLINLIVDTGTGPALLNAATILNLQQDLSDLNNLIS